MYVLLFFVCGCIHVYYLYRINECENSRKMLKWACECSEVLRCTRVSSCIHVCTRVLYTCIIYIYIYTHTYTHTHTQVRLEANKVSNNKHAGLFIDGMDSKANVKECEIMSNGVRGVGVQSGANLQLYKSSIGRNAQEGVFVSGNRYACMYVPALYE
jgi:hypothetical protein